MFYNWWCICWLSNWHKCHKTKWYLTFLFPHGWTSLHHALCATVKNISGLIFSLQDKMSITSSSFQWVFWECLFLFLFIFPSNVIFVVTNNEKWSQSKKSIHLHIPAIALGWLDNVSTNYRVFLRVPVT